MGPTDLKALAKLSSIDLHPQLMPLARVARTDTANGGLREVVRNGELMLVQTRPVETLIETAPEMLVLEYSLTRAMAGYAPILWALFGFGAVGGVLAVAGAFTASRSLSRPI